ncbi:MAG: hypothetical protein QOI68_2574, partial [Pseudonocardiales bacterium]|nr:hypothetical protein [Pseudonocardiales bacterium]
PNDPDPPPELKPEAKPEPRAEHIEAAEPAALEVARAA